jgi:hypothetical protein
MNERQWQSMLKTVGTTAELLAIFRELLVEHGFKKDEIEACLRGTTGHLMDTVAATILSLAVSDVRILEEDEDGETPGYIS